MGFRVVSLDAALAAEVRDTGRSPGYGHPVVREVARGTGPCRSCLDTFAVGAEERLLFTYRPASGVGAVGAPGPVFIHAASCARFEGDGFPAGLRALPLLAEGRTEDGRILVTAALSGALGEPVLEGLLRDPGVAFVFLRHAEAGCHVARVERLE